MSRVFASETDNVIIAPSASINNLAQTALTYAMWVYFPGSVPECFLVGKGDAVGPSPFPGILSQWGVDQGDLFGQTNALFGQISCPLADIWAVTANDVVIPDTWLRIVFTWNNTTDRDFHFFINGVEI